jgi:adenosine/AMP kinase
MTNDSTTENTESLANSNGLQIIVHETDPTAKIYMFIDGKYTHWVEYDVEQMWNMMEVFRKKLDQMVENI